VRSGIRIGAARFRESGKTLFVTPTITGRNERR
jgi:hypothetical protein